MSFLQGLLATLFERLLSWLLGVVRLAYVAWQEVTAIHKRNKEIKEQMDAAQTEEERQEALRKAAEHAGRPGAP